MPDENHSQNTTHHSRDKGYKELLSNKRTFLELLKTFVREDWTAGLREENLNRVEKSYILQDFTEKEADIVYELKTGPDNIIFYCLLELQSTVDYLMPFRLLLYMTEIWRNSFNNISSKDREKKGTDCQPLFPWYSITVLTLGRRPDSSGRCWQVMSNSARNFWTLGIFCLTLIAIKKKT